MNWTDVRSEIELSIKNGEAYERIGKRYGCTGNGIKKVAKRLGIKLERRRNINSNETFNKGKGETILECKNCSIEFKKRPGRNQIYCSKKCSSEYKSKIAIERWLSGEDKRDSLIGAGGMVRNYLLKINKGKCSECGWGKVNIFTGKIPLEVHHIDGDCCNNSIDNLQLLCPNCHALTHNYGSRGGSKNSRERTKYYKKG